MSRSTGIVVIGAGPAGCTAAVQCKRLGETPILLDQSGRAGGLVRNAFSIENYPGLEPTDGETFVRLLDKHITSFGISVEAGNVLHLTRSQEGFITRCGFGEIRSKVVIVAVGTRPNLIDIPGAEDVFGCGLYYDVCSVPSDVKNTVVIGGGEAALDYALSLSRLGAKVTLLVRDKRLRATGRLVQFVEQSPLMSVSYGAQVRSIGRDARGVTLFCATLSGDLTMAVDAVVVAVGRNRQTMEIVKGLDEDLSGAVSTRIPGLFIAGDARTGTLGQAGMAVGDGLNAAMAAVRFVG